MSTAACGGPAGTDATKPAGTTSAAPAPTSPVRLTTSTTGGRPHHKGLKGQRPHGAHVKRVTHVKRKGRHEAARIVHRATLCPLTGLKPRGGRVPQRAAVAVKVENLPEARPQWGLDKADIVFEEPVEGGITRFIAVFQCQTAARIEPVRSGRLVDPQILEPLGRILFGYSGAIQPAIDEFDSRTSLLDDVGADRSGSAYWRDPTRYAPHNLETSTSALYAAAAALRDPGKPPTAIFSYGKPAPGGTPAAAVSIHDPLDTTTWTWRRDTGIYYRSYSDTGAALQGDNVQITASNVIVMLVHEHPTPWPEDATGALENELTLKGSGPAWVFRDGAVYYGTWRRPLLDHPTVFFEQNGTKIILTPGNTWEELVPRGLDVSVEP